MMDPRRILISGSSGLIGCAVVARRRQLGDIVVPLLRGNTRGTGLRWEPGSGTLDPQSVSGFDTVIHLAGEPVLGIWTTRKKQRILNSRVQGTEELVNALVAAHHPPRLFVCASGTNFYGNNGISVLTEDAPKGVGFLSDVCQAWEQASQPIVSVSRLVNLRIGVVLDNRGGTLKKALPVFRSGLAAIMGAGDGYISWISLADVVRVIDHLIDHNGLDGPINVVAPQPVTSEEFIRSIASAVGRGVHMHLPQWPFRLFLGELADETFLSSTRAVPAKLLTDGFHFTDATIGTTLQRLLSCDESRPTREHDQ
jgi:uncharacterized protein (TIGR01777 family)